MLKKKGFWISLYLVVLALVLTAIMIGAGADAEDEYKKRKKERDELAAENEELSDKLDTLNEEIQGMIDSLEANKELETNLILKEQSYSELLATCIKQYDAEKKMLEITESMLKSVNEDIASLESDRARLEAALVQMIRSAHENTENMYLEMLFGSTGIVDFLNRYEYISSVVDYNRNLLSDIKANTELLQDRKAEFETLKAEQEATLALLESRRVQYDKVVSECMEALEELGSESAFLKEILQLKSDDAATVERQLDNVLSQIGSIDDILADIEGDYFFWPSDNPDTLTVSSHYGYRDLEGKKDLHKGVDLRFKYEEVLAVKSGVVVTAKYSSSYGYYIVIAHKNNVQTVYAHLDSLGVKEGDVVKARDVIGISGNTGWSTGAHLHYEIRVNGNYVNPLNCKSLGIKGIQSYLMVPEKNG